MRVRQTIHVLHVYRTYFPETQGGLEEVIRQICRSTSGLGMENKILILGSSPDPAVLGREEAEVHRFHRTFEIASCGVSIGALAGFKHLADWADVIHYHFPWPFADLLHFWGHVRKPSLVTYHSDIVRQKSLFRLYRPLMRAFLERVDVIVPTSRNYFATSEELSRYAEKVEVIPIGLDDGVYPEVSEQELSSARERVGEGFFSSSACCVITRGSISCWTRFRVRR